MVVKRTIIAQKELQELLESDDELPTTYNEIADIPAYQNDNRFDHIFTRSNKVVPPSETLRSKKSDNEPMKFVYSSDRDKSTVFTLVKNKSIVQPAKPKLSGKSNNKSIDFMYSLHEDHSTVFNKINVVRNEEVVQQSNKPVGEKIDKAIAVINLLDKDSSSELTFFANEGIQQKVEDRLLIKKGVLSKENIVGIKCIEATQNNSTFIWFINYLLYKDMQSKYTCLSGCLVGNWNYHENNSKEDVGDMMKCCSNLEIVIKCK